jgi:hypothetical protein
MFFARNGVNEWDGAGPHIEGHTRAKRAFLFCRLAQDGTGEGIFVLDRLPTPDEAATIREILVIAKKREMGEPSEAQLAARAAFAARSRTTKEPENTNSEDKPPARDESPGSTGGESPDGKFKS